MPKKVLIKISNFQITSLIINKKFKIIYSLNLINSINIDYFNFKVLKIIINQHYHNKVFYNLLELSDLVSGYLFFVNL